MRNGWIQGRQGEAIAVGVYILMFGVFFCCMPMYADDLWYSLYIQEGLDWQSLWRTWMEHYQTDNARLANILVVPLLALPKWVGSGIATLAWGYVILRAPRLLGVAETSGLSFMQLALWLSGTAFLLPWYDSIGALDYQFNYVVSSALYVWALRLFLGGKGRGVWLFLLGLVAGAWHEGFALPTLGGMAVAMWLYRPLRTRRNLALMAGILIGVAWLLSGPGLLGRAGAMAAKNGAEPWFPILLKKCLLHPAYLLLLLTLIVRAIRRRTNKNHQAQTYPLSTIHYPLLFTIATLSFLLHLATTVPPRTGWWCELLSILLLCGLWRIRGNWRTSLATLLLVLTGVHMLVVDYYSVRIGHDFRSAIEQYRRDPEATVFMDFPTEQDAPLLTVLAPDFTLFTAPVYRFFHNLYLRSYETDGPGLVVVPQALERVTARSGRALGGNLGVRSVDGSLVMAADAVPQEALTGRLGACAEFRATVSFGDGTSPLGSHTVEGVRMLYIPFTSRADGRRYAYLYPWRQVLPARLFGAPTAVTLP